VLRRALEMRRQVARDGWWNLDARGRRPRLRLLSAILPGRPPAFWRYRRRSHRLGEFSIWHCVCHRPCLSGLGPHVDADMRRDEIGCESSNARSLLGTGLPRSEGDSEHHPAGVPGVEAEARDVAVEAEARDAAVEAEARDAAVEAETREVVGVAVVDLLIRLAPRVRRGRWAARSPRPPRARSVAAGEAGASARALDAPADHAGWAVELTVSVVLPA
jgi:hypothetical protein